MIEVEYLYKKVSGEWKQGSSTFYDIEKAIRFIYKVRSGKKFIYIGFSCDDSETCEYINRRVR